MIVINAGRCVPLHNTLALTCIADYQPLRCGCLYLLGRARNDHSVPRSRRLRTRPSSLPPRQLVNRLSIVDCRILQRTKVCLLTFQYFSCDGGRRGSLLGRDSVISPAAGAGAQWNSSDQYTNRGKCPLRISRCIVEV